LSALPQMSLLGMLKQTKIPKKSALVIRREKSFAYNAADGA